VIVNRQSGFVVDGHLRVAMAISKEESSVPVSYVELSDAEEDMVLAGLDPLSGLAIADPEALQSLLAVDVDGELSGLFAPDDLGWDEQDPDPNWQPIEPDPNQRAENEYVLVCPECGHEFSVTVDEADQ
jgi:hypothetical protein